MRAEAYVNTRQLYRRYGSSISTLHRWQHTQGFPSPVIPGGHGGESWWGECDVKFWEIRRPQLPA